MYSESHARSVAKAVTWRVLGTLTTAGLVFIFTRRLALSLTVGALEFVSKIGIFWLHERIYHLPPDSDRPLVVIESRSHGSSELEAYLQTIRVGQRVRVGSSLKFCRLAEGAADIYPRLGPTMEWDVAAGDCLYRNSAPEGQYTSPLTYNKPDLRNGPFVLGTALSAKAAAAIA